jgi:hypothetical protein
MLTMPEETIHGPAAVDRSEGFGERLIDRAHEMPPQLIAPLVAEVIAVIGGRDVTVLLQDYDQLTLVPLPGRSLLVEAGADRRIVGRSGLPR